MKNNQDFFLSIEQNNLLKVKQMVGEGFNPFVSSQGYKGYPLCLASKKGHEKIVEFLLNYIPASIDDNFPLKIASEMGHVNCVKILLPQSKINDDSSSLSNIIYWSIYKKQDKTVKYILLNTDITLSPSSMILSIIKNHKENIDLLLNRVDIDKVKEKIVFKGAGVDYFLSKLPQDQHKKPKNKKFFLFK